MTAGDTPDLLYGAKAIAAHLGLRRRAAYHRIESGQIPTFKIGGTICASRVALAAWLAQQAEAAPVPPDAE